MDYSPDKMDNTSSDGCAETRDSKQLNSSKKESNTCNTSSDGCAETPASKGLDSSKEKHSNTEMADKTPTKSPTKKPSTTESDRAKRKLETTEAEKSDQSSPTKRQRSPEPAKKKQKLSEPDISNRTPEKSPSKRPRPTDSAKKTLKTSHSEISNRTPEKSPSKKPRSTDSAKKTPNTFQSETEKSPSKKSKSTDPAKKTPKTPHSDKSETTPKKVSTDPTKKAQKMLHLEPPKEPKKDQFEFFYSKASVFSQFHPSKFTVDGIQYNCMEQYMHHQKAVTFKDDIRAKLIMATTDPLQQKKLGRQVKNFDKTVWGHTSIKVVKKGNMEKYGQNPEMKKVLFATYPKILVEASPRDRLWGIGMGKSNPKAQDMKTWRGKNLLGFALTDVRKKMMENDKQKNEESSI